MFLKNKLLNEKSIIVFIFIFSLAINQFFGNRGVYPIDSFGFFDPGYRVLNGEFPFKDYWVVSGATIDYFQALLFWIFGTNWQSYVLQASILNAFFSIFTFIFFRELKLNLKSNFFYTICLSILAYPSSGTPFVDHHATYFSLIAVFFLILAIKRNDSIYWFFVPILLGMAFFSKQVPTAYLAISIFFIIIFNFFFNSKNKNIKIILILLSSTFIFLTFVLLIFTLTETSLLSFFEQYFYYPLNIGEGRFGTYKIDLKNSVYSFKFLHLVFLPFFIINLHKIMTEEGYFKNINFKIFIIFSLSFISLVLHQVFTKNQVFIFFLIPLFAAFSHIEIDKILKESVFKKTLIYTMLALCFFSTAKYHKRFNLDRKFHEMANINFKNSSPAKQLDNRFLGLKWITPIGVEKEKVLQEIKSIKNIKNFLKNDKREKMLVTQYAFFSILLDENLNAPSRWYPTDGTGFPSKGSKYYDNYVNFLIDLIKGKKIKVIYITGDVSTEAIFNYINPNCFEKEIIFPNLTSYLLKKDCENFNRKF